jgi:hypothetical protein
MKFCFRSQHYKTDYSFFFFCKIKNEWSYSSSPVSFVACTGPVCLCVYSIRCAVKLIFCACERKNSFCIKIIFNFMYFLKVDKFLRKVILYLTCTEDKVYIYYSKCFLARIDVFKTGTTEFIIILILYIYIYIYIYIYRLIKKCLCT